MFIEPFGELEYNTGWKKQILITFFEKQYEITLKVKAYNPEDPILEEQKAAYEYFSSNQTSLIHQAELSINSEYDSNNSRFVPTMLLLTRDGDCSLLCDDFFDPDDGIAIVFHDSIEIFSQDDYL